MTEGLAFWGLHLDPPAAVSLGNLICPKDVKQICDPQPPQKTIAFPKGGTCICEMGIKIKADFLDLLQ